MDSKNETLEDLTLLQAEDKCFMAGRSFNITLKIIMTQQGTIALWTYSMR